MHFPQPWIKATVLEKLAQVNNDCFSFSSSTSAFKLYMGKGNAVQVVAFHPSRAEFFTTTISDGTNSVQARIHSRIPREPTRGSIISLRNYHLLTLFPIFDPTSKRADQLMLEVQDFKVLGCENSAEFGRPINILKIDNISATLNQLRTKTMKDSEIQNGPRSQPTSPFGSQLPDPPSGPVSLKEHGTQAMFASQMAAPMSKLPSIPTECKKHDVAPSSKTDLLNLLKKFAPPKPERKQQVWQDERASSSKEIKAAQYSPVLSQIPGGGVLRSASRLDSMANIRQSQLSQVSQSSDEEKSLPMPVGDTPALNQPWVMSDDSEKENSQNSKNQIRISGASEKENSQGSTGQEQVSEPVPAAENEKPAVEIVKITRRAVALPFEDLFNTGGDPFAAGKRIPRTYVAIPRDQQELLERNDAWYPPSTGSTNSYAIIPIKVREDLIAFATKPVKKDVEAPKLDLNLGSDEERSSSDSDDESHDIFHSIEEDDGKEPSTLIGLSGREEHKSTPQDVDSDVVDDWTPSPEAHKHHTLATLGIPPPTLEFSNATDVEPSTTHIEKMQDDLPVSQAIENLPPPLYASRIRTFDFPSSSEVESELEVGDLHAEGEEVEGNGGRIIQIPETSQEVPSPTAHSARLVQVGQFPFANGVAHANDLFCSAGLEAALAINNKAEGGVSSDAIIPAAFKELSQQSKLSKLSIANNMDKASHVDQGGLDIECSIPRNEGKGEVAPATHTEAFSYIFDGQPTFERGSSQVTESNIPSSPPPILAELSFSRNRNDQTSESPSRLHNRSSVSTHNSIPGSPISSRHTEVLSSPQLPTPFAQQISRASSTASTSATTPRKRVRRKPLAAIMKEKFTRKDTREMVRARRHEFDQSFSRTDLKSRQSPPKSFSSPSKPRVSQSGGQPTVQPPRLSPAVEELSTPLRYVHTQQELSSLVQPVPVETAIEAREMVPEQIHNDNTPRSPPHRQIDTYLGSASKAGSTQSKALPLEQSQTNSPSAPDIYKEFMAAYPGYCGSRNNFTWALVYIEWLRKGRQLLHRSLCDDFIRVTSFDYIDYVRGCQGKAKTGWQYYDENVLEQEYSMQIVTPENLQQALSTLDPERIHKIRTAFEQPHETTHSQSQGSTVITHTQTQAMSTPQSQKQDQAESHPGAQSQPPKRRALPWLSERSPVKDPATFSLSKRMEQLEAPIGQHSSIRKIPSQIFSKPKHSPPGSTRSIPASPEYVNLVQEEALQDRITRRAASPILGSQTPPFKSDSKWRKAIENVKRKKEEQARQRSSSPNQPPPASSKRKSTFQPGDVIQSRKRPRIASQKGQTLTYFQPQKLSPPTSSFRSVTSPTPIFQAATLSALKSSFTSTTIPMDGVSKVNGWLDRNPSPKPTPPSFEEFVKKRKASGKLLRRASRLALTTVGGNTSCTNPGRVLADDSGDGTSIGSIRGRVTSGSLVGGCANPKIRAEPETQPWGYKA